MKSFYILTLYRMIYDNFILANGFRRHYHQTTPFGRHVNTMRDVKVANKDKGSLLDVSWRRRQSAFEKTNEFQAS